jgi:signal transduction histidine kinase
MKGASHDLKGALSVINSGLGLLRSQKMDEKAKEIIGHLSAASLNLKNLVQDLLELFRCEAGEEKIEITEFDVNEVLFSFIGSVKYSTQAKDVELKFFGDEKLMVRNDEKKIIRITQNLVLNALKYTSSGFVEINWYRENEKSWVLRIKDTGSGLNEIAAAALTDNPTSGSESQLTDDLAEYDTHGEGIGLIIVKRLCELHDAIIDIETEKDKGTTFEITFPIELQEKQRV